MSDDGLREELRRVVRDHYAVAQARPLLLSTLGNRLAALGHRPPAGQTLARFVEAQVPGEFALISHPDHPLVKIIAPVAATERLQAELSLGESPQSNAQLARFPRPLLLAFCKDLAPGERVYVLRAGGSRYRVTTEELADEAWVEVPEKFRHPGVYIGRIPSLDDTVAKRIRGSIQDWMLENGITSEDLVQHQPKRGGSVGTTALDRLLRAQPEDVKRRMLIPGDIAALLLRHE